MNVANAQAAIAKTLAAWGIFGTRKSALSGSQRLATNPPNAILNYCYALLECETRLAVSALGLDPGMGMLHVDTPNRDSLACDVMEAVRPSVDAWVLDWITREPFRRSDFFRGTKWQLPAIENSYSTVGRHYAHLGQACCAMG